MDLAVWKTCWILTWSVRLAQNSVSIEFLSQKNDASLWALGSHSKKRPHNLTFGRMYDGHVLDILEFGLENYKSLNEFKVGVARPLPHRVKRCTSASNTCSEIVDAAGASTKRWWQTLFLYRWR